MDQNFGEVEFYFYWVQLLLWVFKVFFLGGQKTHINLKLKFF